MLIKIGLPQSKNDLNNRLRFLKLSRSQREGHVNTIVIVSGNFKFQTGWAELKQLTGAARLYRVVSVRTAKLGHCTYKKLDMNCF